MKQYGLEYFKDFWNMIDLTQFLSFMYLFIRKLVTQFSSDSGFEIFLSSVILFLSIYKVLYFVRIYERCSLLLIQITGVTKDLMTFMAVGFALLFCLAKIYQVLHMGVNDPNKQYA
jgi:hypothetical protein